MEKNSVTKFIPLITIIVLTGCASISHPTAASTSMMRNPHSSNYAYNTPFWDGSTAEIWGKLQPLSAAKLTAMQNTSNGEMENAWIQLAIMTKQKNISTQQLASELLAWREHNPSHPANQLLPDNAMLSQLVASPPPHQIAILLPQSGQYAALGHTVREGFLDSYYANLGKIGKQNVKFYDTNQTQNIASLYQQAVTDGADFIIGPLTKDHVQQLRGMRNFPSATLALNYTDSHDSAQPDNFYEFGLLPEDEAGQIAYRAHEAGHSRAIVIAPQNDWGKRLASAFTARWQAVGGSVQAAWYYTPKTNFNEEIAQLLNVNIEADKKLMRKDNHKTVLEQQRRHDFDVIFLFSQPQEARAIVPMLRYYYANDIPVYATSAVYSGKPDPDKDVDLNGVIVCDIPWRLENAATRTQNETSSNRLYAVGQDAYLLSQSMPRLTNLPNFPLYGRTGALTLSSQHQIHRRLPCVAIHNGLI